MNKNECIHGKIVVPAFSVSREFYEANACSVCKTSLYDDHVEKERKEWEAAKAAKVEKERKEWEIERAKEREEKAAQAEIDRVWRLEHPLVKAGKMRKAIATNAPCRADCWYATGSNCQCSCAGRNHGIGCDPKSLRDMFD